MKTETITIEASKIKPNPFKKFINKGRLNNDVISQLVEGYKQTTFHENLTGRRNKKGEIEIIYGHHRLEAVKKVYGKNHKIKINIYSYKDFPDDKMIIDMVRENVTQKGDSFEDMIDSVKLTKEFLEGKLGETSKLLGCSKKTHKQEVTAGDIAKFLSSKNKAISKEQIRKYLAINDNLSPTIKSMITKDNRGNKTEKGNIGFEVAYSLSMLDKNDQKKLAKVVANSNLNRPSLQKNISSFRKSSSEIKEKVKEGKIKLENLEIENLKAEIKQKKEENKDNSQILVIEYKKYLREAGNRIGDTNTKIFQTCAYLEGLYKSGILYELEWSEINSILKEAVKFGENYTKFTNEILRRL